MGSIRPLVTITILVVVGAYLYVKINEGPAQTHAGATNAWNPSPEGVPPLGTTKGASLAADNAAPAWPSTTTSIASPPATTAPPAVANPFPTTANENSASSATAKLAKDGFPTVPPIPELPPLAGMTDATPPATPSPAASSRDLPANIPTARYPGESAQNNNSAAQLNSPATDPGKPIPPITPPQLSGTPPLSTPPASSAPTPFPNNAPQQPAPSDLGTSSAALASQASAQNPLRTAPAPTQLPDRYASASSTTAQPLAATPSQAMAPPETSFASSWPAIQAALDRRDLKQAHQLLSKWHGNEALAPAEKEKVESLLGQLAGTVIYSTEHQLEPARIVKPGESLESIAKEFNVPWQLLAKINGVQSPNQLRPGQELKVVRGPFSAVVDLHRSEVTLLVDERYAGKFQISVPPGTTLADSKWIVDQKLDGPANTVSPASFPTTPIPNDRTIVLRSAAPNAELGAPTLVIASGTPLSGLTANPPCLRVSPQDAEELADILSIGSPVTIRR